LSLSSVAIQSAQALETGEAWLLLLTINHSDLGSPFYLVNNTEQIVSNSIIYLAYPFQITLSPDDGEHLPKVGLSIDNVDRALVETIRSISESPEVTIQLVLSSQPDTVELEITDLVLREVEYDSFQISATLYADDLLNSRYPTDNTTLAAGYKGLFRG